jgi:hypothetical protein
MSNATEIWVMGPGGEDPRLFRSLPAAESFGSMAWSPDGQRLAWVRVRNRRELSDVHTSVETSSLKEERSTTILSEKGVAWGL